MIVPLMIWSARTEIDSQAWTAETAMAARMASARPISSGSVMPMIPILRSGRNCAAMDGGPPGDEGGGQHHALDADVHHPGALVHEPAQRTERDGHGGSHDGRRDHRQLDDDVHDELDDQADDRDVVQEVHQRPTSSPARRSCGSPSAARSRAPVRGGAYPEDPAHDDLGGQEEEDDRLQDADDLRRDARPGSASGRRRPAWPRTGARRTGCRPGSPAPAARPRWRRSRPWSPYEAGM